MRGIALKTMVGLIMALLIGAVIFLVIFKTGMVEQFSESMILMFTTLSSYFRIIIIDVINILIVITEILVLVVLIFKLITGGGRISSIKDFMKAWGGGYVTYGQAVGFFAGIAGSIFAVALFIVFLIFNNSVLSQIPLFAPSISINIGTKNSPEENTTIVAQRIAEKISNTWNAFGAGHGDPLEGLKNPHLYYVIFVHLKDGKNLTMEDVYNNLTAHYNIDYPIWVYCEDSEGILGYATPVCAKYFDNPTSGSIPYYTCAGLESVSESTALKWVIIWAKSGGKCDPLPVHLVQGYGKNCTIKDGSQINIYYVDAYSIQAQGATMLTTYGISQPDDCSYVCGVGVVPRDGIVVCIHNR